MKQGGDRDFRKAHGRLYKEVLQCESTLNKAALLNDVCVMQEGVVVVDCRKELELSRLRVQTRSESQWLKETEPLVFANCLTKQSDRSGGQQCRSHRKKKHCRFDPLCWGFPNCARVFCTSSDFPVQPEDKHDGQTGKSKLSAGVTNAENGCLSCDVAL